MNRRYSPAASRQIAISRAVLEIDEGESFVRDARATMDIALRFVLEGNEASALDWYGAAVIAARMAKNCADTAAGFMPKSRRASHAICRRLARAGSL